MKQSVWTRLTQCALLATLLFGLGCMSSQMTQSAPAAQAPLTVFAASSLTDAFKELGALFESTTGTPVTFNFGASTQLRTQLEQGAVADVFASADTIQMDRARQSGVIAGVDQIFATNRLVVITPARNPAGITGPGDLANPGIKIVTAQQDVPVGVYTQTMLDAMSQDARFGADFKSRANANIVSREPNVRQIVAKILLGEGDAAVVYRTDITPQAAADLLMVEIPDAFNTLAQYPIARVVNAPQGDAGSMFIAMLMSPVGQTVLQKWNFLPAPAMGAASNVPQRFEVS
jgi:molybdate transport system substrate-binding protein